MVYHALYHSLARLGIALLGFHRIHLIYSTQYLCTQAIMKKSPSMLCLRPLLINLSSVKTIHFLHNKAPADWRRRFKALCKDLTCRCLPSRPLRYLRFHLLTRPLCSSARLSDIACLSWAIAGVFFKNSCLILRPAVASEWIIFPIFASPAPYFVFERSRYFLPVLLWTAICCHIEQTISSLFSQRTPLPLAWVYSLSG